MKQFDEILRIKQRMEEVDVISFDIFDTLLLRNVISPTDLFKVVEIEYFNKTGRSLEFKKNRVLAEENARRISDNEDVTFEEIYNQLEKILPNVARELQEIEVKIEEEFLITNTRMLELYHWALDKGKKVLIISDMYLPLSVINELLRSRGYEGEHTCYISCEVMRSKATGTLYNYIRNQENINQKEKWFHIGDNYVADYVNAKKAGILAYHYKAVRERYEVIKYSTLLESIVRALQVNMMYLTDNDYWYNFGVDKAAPLYIGFMSWLERELEGKDNIYFLARDGYIPYKLYKMMCEINDKLPKGKYLYASRRAYIYPNLLNMHREEALDLLMAANRDLDQYITVSEILENIGLECDKYKDELSLKGITEYDELLKDEKQIQVVRGFLEEIWTDIEEVLKEEANILKAYFKQEGLYDYTEINIVDIGWRGSTHKSLQQLLGKKVNGYYLGTIKEIYYDIKENSRGYLFNEGKPRGCRKLTMENVMIFELMFSAPMGSVFNFIETEGEIVPRLIAVEKDAKIYEKIDSMQNGIEKIFGELYRYKKYLYPMNITLLAQAVLYQFITGHCIKDMIAFEQLSTSVGMGNTSGIKKYVYRIRDEEYISNSRIIDEKGKQLPWKNAIIIEDNDNRLFNINEYRNLKKMKQHIDLSGIEKLFKLIKKAILNPKKLLKWIVRKVKG